MWEKNLSGIKSSKVEKKPPAAIFHNHPECQNVSCLHCYISKLKNFKDFCHLTTALTVYIRVNGNSI